MIKTILAWLFAFSLFTGVGKSQTVSAPVTGTVSGNVSGTITGTVEIPLTALPQPTETSFNACDAVKIPQCFGAAGDGVTDDTAALQKWIDSCTVSGCTLNLGVGKYRITQGLTIPSTVAVEMDGAGPSGGGPGSQAGNLAVSEILCDGADITALTFGDIHSYSYNGPTLRNIGFYDPKGKCAGAVRIINESYEKLDRVLTENFSKAGINPPSGVTAQSESGGSIPAGSHTVQTSYQNPSGETLAGQPLAITLASGQGTLVVSSPPAEGDATGYSTYIDGKLQNLENGPVPIGQPTTITQLENGWAPEEFNTSGAFGVNIHGTMRGYGYPSAFVNQPLFTDFNSMSTYNSIVADRSVADPMILGGNLNLGNLGEGCGLGPLEGSANVQTHLEGGQAGATMVCLTGWTGFGRLSLDLIRAGENGIVGRNLHNWTIRGTCSAVGGTATPFTQDSKSGGNDVKFMSNGTCQ